MQFTTRKRRTAPTVIIVSLIDVLIVVLIFLMVTTTFKQQPALKLALPESNQPKIGAAANTVIVSIPKNGPIFFGLEKDPVTLDGLVQRLTAAAKANPDLTLSINADTEAPWGQVVKVRDAAKAANIKSVQAAVRNGPAP